MCSCLRMIRWVVSFFMDHDGMHVLFFFFTPAWQFHVYCQVRSLPKQPRSNQLEYQGLHMLERGVDSVKGRISAVRRLRLASSYHTVVVDFLSLYCLVKKHHDIIYREENRPATDGIDLCCKIPCPLLLVPFFMLSVLLRVLHVSMNGRHYNSRDR